jgi:hypothetical protein
MENIKKSKEEVSILSSFKFRETSFRRHDPEGLLKRHLRKLISYGHMHTNIFFPER